MSRSSSAHVLIESGEEANTVYNNGYFGLMDYKDEKESFNRRNENVKLVQKNWVPGGDFEVLEEREDEVDWLDDDHEELDKDQDNEVDLTLDDGSSTRRSTNIHWNIHLKMSQCRQNLGRHEALIVFTFIPFLTSRQTIDFLRTWKGHGRPQPFSKSEKKHRFEFLDLFLVSMPNFVKFRDVQFNPY